MVQKSCSTLDQIPEVRNPMNSWLVRPTMRTSATLRLYLFPWSGAGRRAYQVLCEALPTFIEPVIVQLPGRGRRSAEPAYARLDEAAGPLAGAIQQDISNDTIPFAVLGHSYGALLAFNVVRRLADAGWCPNLLIASGSRAPVQPPAVTLHELSDHLLAQSLIHLGGTSPDKLTEPAFYQRTLPVVRADLTACEQYRAPETTTISSPISAWSGDDDWYATPQAVAEWRVVADSGFRTQTFSGGHFFIEDVKKVVFSLLTDLAWANQGGMSPAAMNGGNIGVPVDRLSAERTAPLRS